MTAKNAGFAPGEAEAIVTALEPGIQSAARAAWARHPRNPINMDVQALRAEIAAMSRKQGGDDRLARLKAELRRR